MYTEIFKDCFILLEKAKYINNSSCIISTNKSALKQNMYMRHASLKFIPTKER